MPKEGDNQLKFRERQLLNPSLFEGKALIFMAQYSERIYQQLANTAPIMPSPNEIPHSITAKPPPSSEPANSSIIDLYMIVNHPS